MGNWSWLEVIWTLVAGLGAYFSLRNIKAGLEDIESLRIAPYKNGRWLLVNTLAKRSVLIDSLRLIPQAMFVFLGVVAGFNPQHPTTPTGIFAGFIFITCSLMFTLASFVDFNTRKKLLILGEELEEKKVDAE